MNHVMQQRNNYIRDRITLTSFAPVKHFFVLATWFTTSAVLNHITTTQT